MKMCLEGSSSWLQVYTQSSQTRSVLVNTPRDKESSVTALMQGQLSSRTTLVEMTIKTEC